MLDPSTDSNFLALIQESERPDGYVNATKWCKEFGYPLADWKRSPQTKAQIKALNKHWDYHRITPCIVEGKGRSAITWVHPIMAIHLAKYLSPEFSNFVAQTFQRYLKGDASLAIEIIDRIKSPEDLRKVHQRSGARLESIATRKSETAAFAATGFVTDGRQYAELTNATYEGFYGKTAQQLKSERGLSKRDSLRDALDSEDELNSCAIRLSEMAAARKAKQSTSYVDLKRNIFEQAQRVKVAIA
jgi:hypothetical protein